MNVSRACFSISLALRSEFATSSLACLPEKICCSGPGLIVVLRLSIILCTEASSSFRRLFVCCCFVFGFFVCFF